MSVVEAVQKFKQLSRLCSFLVNTEEERLRKMMDMLCPDIALAIESGDSLPTMIVKCVERAIRIEYRLAQLKEERAQNFEARRNQQRRVPTEGLNLIISRIRQQTSRRRGSPRVKGVKVISRRKRTSRTTQLARSVVRLILESAEQEILTYAIDAV